MKDFSDLDVDEQALIKKKRPWGWFAAGLVAIVALTFATGFALPLHRSHATLKTEHEALAKKAAELDHALIKTKKKLGETEEQRSRLEKKIARVTEARAELSSRLDMAATTAERQLESLIEADIANVSKSSDSVEISLPNRVVFLPRSTRVSPSIIRSLCRAVESIGKERTWQLTAVVTLPQKAEDPWEKSGEQAGALATRLIESCELPSRRVSTSTREVPADGRTETTILTLGPAKAPQLPHETGDEQGG